MAILTTGALIVGGIFVALGTGGAIWAACTKDDRTKEKIKQLETENKQLVSTKNILTELNNNLIKAKEYLTEGNKIFENGGHVSSGVALANKENNTCYNKLDDALKNSKNLINDINTTINNNNQEIKKEKAKL